MGKRGVENVADASIDALRIALNVAQEYVLRATTRRVSPSAKDVAALARFHEGFPAEPSDAVSVIELLHEIGGPATVATTGGRYFGYVIGGALPASMAANWLAGAWDQNVALRAMSPIAAELFWCGTLWRCGGR